MKKELEKNRLDLAYQRQLNYLNIILLLGTIGILSFISTFIWKREVLLQGFVMSFLILIIVYFLHKKVDKSLKSISNKIGNL